jgi:RHS repeat-associated protein
MAGISSEALNFGDPENKKGFNGNELQDKEFTVSGLAWYDFNARTYDPQVGRFIQIDPLPDDGDQESFTPYQFGLDNPILNNDPDGKCPSCIIGGIVGFLVDATVQVGSSITRSIVNGESPSLRTVWRDYSGVQGAGAFGAGFVTQGVSAYEEGTAAVVKTVAVNATFSAATQLGTDVKIDPMITAIDAAPIPEFKGPSLINTNDAQKAVKSAENSIKSSTSAIPERKINQLNQATNNLKTQNAVNTTYKNSVSSLREGAVKEVANGVNKSLSSNSSGKVSPMIPFNNIHSGSDATRVVKPLPIIFKH